MKIITLTLNPAFDMHCRMEDFVPGHENLADITAVEAGGKGVNISRALVRCSVENTALVVLGTENSDAFERALSADGIAYTAIAVPGRIRENITLHPDHAPETRISFRGFSADQSLLAQVEALLDTQIEGDSVLTFTGSLPSGISAADARSFLCRMKAKGAKIVIDSRSFTLEDIAAVHPWLIKPNEEEIAMYTSMAVTDLRSAAAAAMQLQQSCAENVMISLGGAGAVLAAGDGCWAVQAPRVDVKSTIGAGDSAIGGFIAAAEEGCTSPALLKRAVCYGSAACMTEGTRPPHLTDVEMLMTQVSVYSAE
ncbi:MAG: hexose kinase [Clostridia bacterium]|nr:hexose kinase [Clostridia bacterium]